MNWLVPDLRFLACSIKWILFQVSAFKPSGSCLLFKMENFSFKLLKKVEASKFDFGRVKFEKLSA